MYPILTANQTVITLSACAVLSLALWTIYALFFHPLAGIPGPFWQRLSGVPRMWQCYKGNRHIKEWEAHEKYGPVIRIAPNAIAFSSLSALQVIHAKDANVFKGDEFYGLLDGGADGGRSIQMTADNEAHAARRKVFNRAMPAREQTFRSLNRLAQNLAETAKSCSSAPTQMEKGMGDQTASVDISSVSSWYSFDVITCVAFGKSLDMLRSVDYRWVPGCLQSLSIFLYWAGYAPYVRFWRWFLGSDFPSLLHMQTAIDAQIYAQFASDLVTNRTSRLLEDGYENEKADDIFEHLIKVKLYNGRDLRADSSLLIAAGSDAVRLTIAATIFFWLQNPTSFQKATEEIRGCVTATEQITDNKLSSLRYLRACVDETMRLCPPKASSLPREVRRGGISIDGIHVPKGMTVGTSTFALHHDPDIFPNPFVYNPNRWLLQPQDRRMHAAFNPFLKGPRICPGQTVAYFAIELALFHLVYRFDVREASSVQTKVDRGAGFGGTDAYQFNDWILGYADGPYIDLKERRV